MTFGIRLVRGAVVVVGLAGAGAAWLAPAERWPAPPRPGSSPPVVVTTPQPVDLDSVASVAVAANPFRPDRRSSEFRWGEPVASVSPAVVLGASPDVRVHGILHGQTPMAILSIGDDSSHTLVRVGAEARGVTLRSVSARSVELAWGDSTWSVLVAGGAP